MLLRYVRLFFLCVKTGTTLCYIINHIMKTVKTCEIFMAFAMPLGGTSIGYLKIFIIFIL